MRAAQDLDWFWGSAWAHLWVANCSKLLGHLARAREEAEIALRAGTAVHDPYLISEAELHCAEVARLRGEQGVREALSRALEVVAHADIVLVAGVESAQAQLQVSLGELDDGNPMLEAATLKTESLGLTDVVNRALLAQVALMLGDLPAARRHLSAAYATGHSQAIGWEGAMLPAEARVARAEGRLQQAHGLACEGVEAAFRSGILLWAIDALELAAITTSELGRHGVAARLLGAAERQREVTGYVRSVSALVELAPVIGEIAACLGREPFEQAMSQGRSLTLEDAVAYAGRGRERRSRAGAGWASLTPTERKVVSLVAERLTNAEIAQRMFVSRVTVKSHLTRVFDKLGVDNRRELASVAIAGARAEEIRR